MFRHVLNALSPILVTLYALPSIAILDGIIVEVKFLLQSVIVTYSSSIKYVIPSFVTIVLLPAL